MHSPPGASLLLPPWQRNTPKQQKAVAILAIALRPRYIFFFAALTRTRVNNSQSRPAVGNYGERRGRITIVPLSPLHARKKGLLWTLSFFLGKGLSRLFPSALKSSPRAIFFRGRVFFYSIFRVRALSIFSSPSYKLPAAVEWTIAGRSLFFLRRHKRERPPLSQRGTLQLTRSVPTSAVLFPPLPFISAESFLVR